MQTPNWVESRIVDESLVEHSLNVLSACINDNHLVNIEKYTTVGGFQTPSVLEFFSEDMLNQLTYSEEYFVNDIFLIKYLSGGYQKYHQHRKNLNRMYDRKINFCLYLNDSDGDTILYSRDKIKIIPEKCKIVYFDIRIPHEALVVTNEKNVLVGECVLKKQTICECQEKWVK